MPQQRIDEPAGLGMLARHSSHYFLGQLAVMAAGFISMPILTRVLTKGDFGQLSLILLSVNFLAPFARLGLPQSVTRHFAEYAGAGSESVRSYTSTILLCTTAIAFGLVAIFAVLAFAVAALQWGGPWKCTSLIGPLLASEVALTVISELYRAQLRSFVTAALTVVMRYAALAGSLVFFFCISRTFFSFLAGRTLMQVAISIGFALPFIISGQLRLRPIDMNIVKEGVRYGFPLSLAASGGFFIAYGDRYVIQALLNSTQVATYSVPYDLVQQIETALTTPIRLAIIPIAFSMLAGGGIGKASAFLSDVVRGAIFLMVPIILGLSFLGRDIIVLLASDKYADSSQLLPLLSTGILLGGLSFLLSVGLSFRKRTSLIAVMTIAAGLLNIGLNAILIPLLGIMGSAWATLATYVLYLVASYRLSSPYLPVRLYPSSFLRAVVAALCMIAVLWAIRPNLGDSPLALLLQILLGTAVYAVAVLLLEPSARLYLSKLLKQRQIIPRAVA